MKKMLSCLLVVVLVLSLVPAAFAADDEGLADAILSAKSRISVPEEYSEFESDLYTDDLGNTVYTLFWYAESEMGGTKRITVEINSRNDIISYRNSAAGDASGEMRFANFSGEEIKTLAKDWLAVVNPGWLADLPEDKISYPAYGNTRYHTDSVSFTRQVNGLDYCNDRVRISVNNLTGEIVSMNASWTYETPAYLPEDALTPEEAGARFLEQSPMELAYQSTGGGEAQLVYTPKTPYLQLNGRTGEEFEEFNLYRDYGSAGGSNTAMAEAAMDAAEEEKFTESELKNLQEVEGLLSEDILRASAEALENTGIAEASFVSVSYENYKEEIDGEEVVRYNAHLSYITPGEEELYHNIYFDAKTGELLSYNSYPSNWDDSEPEISAEDARKKADSFLIAYAPEEFEEAQADQNEQDGKSDYYFTYTRHANEIPYHANSLSVSVDKNTGRIQRFYKNWNDKMTFASPDGIMTAEEAGAKLVAQAGMVLTYAKAQDGDSNIPKIDLMYTLNHEVPYVVDAKTGELLGYDLTAYTPASEETLLPEDISGHYAEARIIKLIESGILEETEAFRPDDEITQKEMLAFACGLNMGYIPYTLEYNALAKRVGGYGITDISDSPDAPVTREQAVEYIVCALGYKEVAELSGIFVTGFVDQAEVTAGKLGYLALAQGLNIVHGNDSGYFKPQEKLTRSDAAIMIYNYMNR